MQRRGKKYEKFFADGQYGGRRASLQAAKLYRDELEDRLRSYSVKELARNPSVRNKSGIVGVRRTVQVEETSDYVYTVYLFSTRSQDVANEVNQRLQKAGHSTQIYEHDSGENKRYRVVVTGFDTRQAATKYSDSVVGKLGIADTWIGRDRREE